MKRKALSIVLAAVLLMSVFSVPAMAESEDITVYSQNFDSLIGVSGNSITSADRVITGIGEKAESASTVDIVSEAELGRYLESFTTVSDVSGIANITAVLPVITGSENGVMTASVTGNELVLAKTATGSVANVSYDFNSDKAVKNLDDYLISIDIKTNFENKQTVNLTLGADFSIRCADVANQTCTIEYHNGTSWVNTDNTTYDFSDYQHISFAVRTAEDGTKTVDMYMGEGENMALIYENVPQRGSNNMKKLVCTTGSSAKGTFYIDNYYSSATLPEVRGDIFYVNDFDGAVSVPTEFVVSGSDYGTAEVSGDKLVVNKTATGGTPGIDFSIANLLKAEDSYSIAFDLDGKVKNSTIVLYLGCVFALRPVNGSEGVYTLEYYYTAADETETSGFKAIENYTVDLNNPVNFRIEVSEKSKANLMIGGEYLMASETEKLEITQRDSYSWDELSLRFGNGATGTLSMDNVAITRGAVVYTAPETSEEEGAPAENGFMQIAKLYEKNGTSTTFSFDELLCGADDYTLSFEINPLLTTGSINLHMGAFFELLRQSDKVYKINYREGDETSNKLLAENITIDGYVNVKIKVTDGTSFALYIDDVLIGENIVARDGHNQKRFTIARNNGMLGNVLIDDVSLTLNGVERASGESAALGDDFENFTTGPVVAEVGAYRTSASADKGLVSIEKLDDTKGNVLRMYTSFNGDETPYHLSRNFSDVAKGAKEYSLSFDVMLEGYQSYSIAEKSSGSGGFKINLDLSQGKAKYQKNGEWVTAESFDITANTWYTVKYVVDTVNKTADVYINDALMVADLDSYLGSPCGGLIISTNASTQGSLYLDNVAVAVLTEADASVSAQYTDGTLYVKGYVPASAEATLYIAYYDGAENGSLLKVDMIPCKAGEAIEKSVTSLPQGTKAVNAMLWKGEVTPLCANSYVIMESEE